MEGFNKHLRLFLITSALAVGGVAAALYYTLTRFNDIQLSFEVELPLLLSWVFPTFKYWFVISVIIFMLFILSFKSNIRHSTSFIRTAFGATIVGYVCSITFVCFSVLAIYWPVMQS